MKIYVINLERSKKRWESISKQLELTGFPFERVNAIDGKEIPFENYEKLCMPLSDWKKVSWPQELTKTELACYLSHMKCWEKLIKSGENYACILEDDVRLKTDFKKFISDDMWIPTNVHVLQIHNALNVKKFYCDYSMKLDETSDLIKPFWPYPFGSQAYIISKEAALKAISLSEKIIGPLDYFLFSPESSFYSQFPTYRLNPSVVDSAHFSSDIGRRDPNCVRKLPLYIRYAPLRLFNKMILRFKICRTKSCEVS